MQLYVSSVYWFSVMSLFYFFFFSSRRRHTRCLSDWSSDVCSSDLVFHYQWREVRGDFLRSLQLNVQRVRRGTIHASNPQVSLVSQANQMCQNPGLGPVAPHLTEHHILRMKRFRDHPKIALITRQSQNSCVADDSVVLATQGGELFYHAVRQSVAEPNHAGVAGFIIEPNHSHNWRRLRLSLGPQPVSGVKSDCKKKESARYRDCFRRESSPSGIRFRSAWCR